MPNHGGFLPIHLLRLVSVTFHGTTPSNSPPIQIPLPKIPIGQPLGALPSPQLIPPTVNLLPPPPPLIQTTSHNMSQLLSNTSTPSAGAPSTAANISSQHMVGHGLPPVSKKEQIEFVQVNSLILLSFLQQKEKLDPYNPQKGVFSLSVPMTCYNRSVSFQTWQPGCSVFHCTLL